MEHSAIKLDMALLGLTDEIVQYMTFSVVPVEMQMRSKMSTIFMYPSIGFVWSNIPVSEGKLLVCWKPEPITLNQHVSSPYPKTAISWRTACVNCYEIRKNQKWN